MKRILIILIILLIPLLSSCKKVQKALIYFSSKPILKETFTVEKAEVYFKPGQRINFVIYNPNPFTSNILKIQILKISTKPPSYNFSIAHAREIEIDKNLHYAINSFCLHKEGYYLLRVFSKDNLEKPIAEADFKLE